MPASDSFHWPVPAGERGGSDGRGAFVRDPYQSRQRPYPERRARLDPVVHGRGDRCPLLDREQVGAFESDGFLGLDRVFDTSRVAAWREEAERLRRDPDLAGRAEVITEPGSGVVRSIFRIHDISPVFSELARDPLLLETARFILGGDVYIHQSRLNYKPAFKGREFYWHSDFETSHVEDGMPRMRAVSVSVTLSENSHLNGPLMLIPGSHKTYISCVGRTPDQHYKTSLKQQEYGVPDETSVAEMARAGGVMAPTGRAGSVVIFDCNTMHGSNSNITPFPRTNAFFVYNACGNALVEPYGERDARPEFIAGRNFTPFRSAN